MRFTSLSIFLIPFFGYGQSDKVLSVDEIMKLIPDKIKGYSQSNDPKAKLVTLGNIRYSLVEKNFANGNKKIKILLFDYKEAPIMYNQATRKLYDFKPIETDSLILRSLALTNCTGWETYNSRNNSSQILLGICDRFFLTVDGYKVSLNDLKKIVESFKVEDFPK